MSKILKTWVRTTLALLIASFICVAILAGCGEKEQPAASGIDNPIQAEDNEENNNNNNGNNDKNDKNEIQFNSTIKESDGEIFVSGAELSVVINIERESTDYWEMQTISGEDIFALIENNPPGKVSQDGHSWIFEAVKPGSAVMEFIVYDENNSVKGNGYRFSFYVDDFLTITGDANITILKGDGFADDEITDMLRVIVSDIYETDNVIFEVSPNTYNLLDEESWVYFAECGNGRKCSLIVLSDGSVYINESDEAFNFKKIWIGNYIIIGEPVEDYYLGINHIALVQEVMDALVEQPGTAVAAEGDYANVFVDHRRVLVYAISHEFDVGGFIAVDPSAENIYYDRYGNGEYVRVLRGFDDYSTGETVTIMPGM